jgi:hypothetical protein
MSTTWLDRGTVVRTQSKAKLQEGTQHLHKGRETCYSVVLKK